MTRFTKLVSSFRSDRRGGTGIEGVLLAGLIVATVAIGYGTFGNETETTAGGSGVCISSDLCTPDDLSSNVPPAMIASGPANRP